MIGVELLLLAILSCAMGNTPANSDSYSRQALGFTGAVIAWSVWACWAAFRIAVFLREYLGHVPAA